MNQRIWTIGPYDPCPCGSGKTFKFCHRNAVKGKDGPVLLQMHKQQQDVDVLLGLAWIDVRPWMRRYPHQHQPSLVCYPTKPAHWPPLKEQVSALQRLLPLMPMGGKEGVPGHLDGHAMKVLISQRHGEFWGLHVGFSEAIDRLLAVAELGDGGTADVMSSRGVEFYQEVDLRLPDDELIYWLHLVRVWGMTVLTIYENGQVDPRDTERVTRIYVPAEQVVIRHKGDPEPRAVGWTNPGFSLESVEPGGPGRPVITWGALEWSIQRVECDAPDEQFAVVCTGLVPGAPRVAIVAMAGGSLRIESPDLPRPLEVPNAGDGLAQLAACDPHAVRTVLLGYLGTLRKAGLWRPEGSTR